MAQSTKSYRQTIRVKERTAGSRIDHFILKQIDQGYIDFEDLQIVLSRTKIQKFIQDGQIMVNDLFVKQSYITRPDDVVKLKIPLVYGTGVDTIPEKIHFEIIYNDKDILVINKPAGLVVHPAHGHFHHTMVNGVLYYFPDMIKNTNLDRMGLVHRLDKDTSGIIIIAKNEVAQVNLCAQFKNREIKKEYAAIVHGQLEQESGEIHGRIGRNPIHRQRMTVLITGGKESYTSYKVKKYMNNSTYVKLFPHTGRTHQLRVHMRSLNHPVVGDVIYTKKKSNFKNLGLMLHAKKIRFSHPRTSRVMELESGLPPRFQILIDRGEV
jgi:23S rRNA pseudouridine1911/1915/1917 synthase